MLSKFPRLVAHWLKHDPDATGKLPVDLVVEGVLKQTPIPAGLALQSKITSPEPEPLATTHRRLAPVSAPCLQAPPLTTCCFFPDRHSYDPPARLSVVPRMFLQRRLNKLKIPLWNPKPEDPRSLRDMLLDPKLPSFSELYSTEDCGPEVKPDAAILEVQVKRRKSAWRVHCATMGEAIAQAVAKADLPPGCGAHKMQKCRILGLSGPPLPTTPHCPTAPSPTCAAASAPSCRSGDPQQHTPCSSARPASRSALARPARTSHPVARPTRALQASCSASTTGSRRRASSRCSAAGVVTW